MQHVVRLRGETLHHALIHLELAHAYHGRRGLGRLGSGCNLGLLRQRAESLPHIYRVRHSLDLVGLLILYRPARHALVVFKIRGLVDLVESQLEGVVEHPGQELAQQVGTLLQARVRIDFY